MGRFQQLIGRQELGLGLNQMHRMRKPLERQPKEREPKEQQQGLLGRLDCMVGVMVGLDRMVGVVEVLDHMAVVVVEAIEHMVVGVVEELGRMVLVLAVEVLATRLEQRVHLVSMERKQLGAGHCFDYTLPARRRQLVPVQNMAVVVAILRMAAVVVAVHIAAQVHCALSNGREQKKTKRNVKSTNCNR